MTVHKIFAKQKNMADQQEPAKISLGEDYHQPTIVESLCPVCEQNGETRLLLTKIPHFREVIISSFYCEHCGHKNQEVQFSGEYAEKGIRIELAVQAAKVRCVKNAQAHLLNLVFYAGY